MAAAVAQSNESRPDLIFGSGNVGSEFYELASTEQVDGLLKRLAGLGVSRLDVTPRHPPGHEFLAEALYGRAGAAGGGFAIDGKNWLDVRDPSGSLARQAVHDSIDGSLRRLGLGRLNVFYAYAPDGETPLEEQAAAMDEQHRLGKFEELGLSNFPPALVERWVAICEDKGYVRPTVYQGQYNLLHRGPEASLLPLLRRHGMALVAYSPLAGGLLSGKVQGGGRDPAGDPAGVEGNPRAKILRDRLETHQGLRDAIEQCSEALRPYGISLPDAALRWLYHHSQLGAGDGIILGAGKVSQLEQSVRAARDGPLPEDVVRAINNIGQKLSQ